MYQRKKPKTYAPTGQRLCGEAGEGRASDDKSPGKKKTLNLLDQVAKKRKKKKSTKKALVGLKGYGKYLSSMRKFWGHSRRRLPSEKKNGPIRDSSWGKNEAN